MLLDPRTISGPVYTHLDELKKKTTDDKTKKEQKGQAVELYTYLATWGLQRLKAEELASKGGKQEIVKAFFAVLKKISETGNKLEELHKMPAQEYLGLTGLGLQVAREFGFWARALYHDVTADGDD